MKKGFPFFALAAVILLFFSVFPFYWSIVTSLKKGNQIFQVDFWIKFPEWKNYLLIYMEQPFLINLWNSICIAAMTVGLSLALGAFAAYPLSDRNFTERKWILYSFLLISFFPQVTILSGLFELIRALGIYNTRFGLALSYLIFTLPFTIWTLCSFLKNIPKEIHEAALLDGAKSFMIITRILMPMMKPALISTGLLAFITSWNEFLFALTFTLTDRSRTVPVAIALMSGSSEYELPWARIMAASVTVTLPVLLLIIFFQKRLVPGMLTGALKG